MAAFDTIIRGGTVIDGTGGRACVTDVGIVDGRVALLDDLAAAIAPEVVDARGKIVAPGFIDIHTHSDLAHLIDPRAESQIRQGVTTEAIGQCGISLAPCTAESRPEVFKAMGPRSAVTGTPMASCSPRWIWRASPRMWLGSLATVRYALR